jgi:hypothetical protein
VTLGTGIAIAGLWCGVAAIIFQSDEIPWTVIVAFVALTVFIVIFPIPDDLAPRPTRLVGTIFDKPVK